MKKKKKPSVHHWGELSPIFALPTVFLVITSGNQWKRGGHLLLIDFFVSGTPRDSKLILWSVVVLQNSLKYQFFSFYPTFIITFNSSNTLLRGKTVHISCSTQWSCHTYKFTLSDYVVPSALYNSKLWFGRIWIFIIITVGEMITCDFLLSKLFITIEEISLNSSEYLILIRRTIDISFQCKLWFYYLLYNNFE